MLFKHAARLELFRDSEQLWDGAVETLRSIGFDHAIYLTVDAAYANPYLRCTLPQIYAERAPQDDPFLRWACDSYDILAIGQAFVDSHPYLSDDERDFVMRAGAVGVTAALGIPMRLRGSERFGGFIVANGMDRATFTERMLPRAEEVRLFCLLIHRRLEELAEVEEPRTNEDFSSPMLAPDLPERFDALTPREREVIYLLARGHTRQEAAQACGISIHTVSDYAKSAYRKLDVHNPAQVAALMVTSGGE